MARKRVYYIKLEFDADQADRLILMSRVRDFGEIVFRELKHDPRLRFNFDVIDAAWNSFHFTSTSEIIGKRAAKRVEQLLPDSNLTATVTVSDQPDNP